MPGYYDVYALASSRRPETIEQFLADFAPIREQAADEYEVPQYATEPDCVFLHFDEVVSHCVAHPNEPYGLYWRCPRGGDPAHAMVFFTADGSLILGLSVAQNETQWLKKMLVFSQSTTGCILFEQPPPDCAEAFKRLAADAK